MKGKKAQPSRTDNPTKESARIEIPDRRGLFDLIPVACFLFGDDGRILQANGVAAALLGYSPEKIAGMKIDDFAEPGDLAKYRHYYDLVLGSDGMHECELRIIGKTGGKRTVWWQSSRLRDDRGTITGIFSIGTDITERIEAEHRQKLTIGLLQLLNRQTGETDTIRDLLFLVKEATGFEAVAIRLKVGDDYPYFTTIGFPAIFVEAERYLCSRDSHGEIIRDSNGNPCLECMCGNVICGRIDPKYPFFTTGGSFWTNSTSELLATTTEEDRQARTRNRCNGEGYESVALIPLRSDTEIIGLLQLNDSQENRFSPDTITFFEGIGASIGVALARLQAEQEVRKTQKMVAEAERIAQLGSWEWDLVADTLTWSDELYRVCGFDRDQFDGDIQQAFMNCVAGEDVERVARVLNSRPGSTDTFEIEYSFVRPDGSGRYLRTEAEIMTDEAGRPVKMIGLTQDITEKKLASDALHRAHLELEKRVDERTIELAKSNEQLREEINERKVVEAKLKRFADQLKHERQMLEKKNVALREILDHISDEREALRRQIAANVEESIIPTVLRLKESSDPVISEAVRLLEHDLRKITSPFLDVLKSRYARLSPRELEVCRLVKHGYTSKEIALALNISEQTVIKQRKMIRKKLGISNQEINLATFLDTII